MSERHRRLHISLSILALLSLLLSVALVQGESVSSALRDNPWTAFVASGAALVFLVSSFALYCTWFDDLGLGANDGTQHPQ